MASRPFPRSMSEDRKNIPSVSVAGQASTCPTVAANSGPRPIRSSDRGRTDHRDTLPATQFDGLFFLFSRRTAAGRHRRPQPVQRPESRNEQDGARSSRPGTPHRGRAAPLDLDHSRHCAPRAFLVLCEDAVHAGAVTAMARRVGFDEAEAPLRLREVGGTRGRPSRLARRKGWAPARCGSNEC